MAERIPVVIVAGFLGAGKTTLLNHLLRDNRGTRIGVVVNDFGAINIDSMLVAGQVDAMVSLGNGCVCCAIDVSELDALFTRLAQPRAQIDVIVVEASGLAEPRNLIRMVVGSDNPRIRYGGLVEVVDAEHFSAARDRHPELATHIRLADLVVVNKADRVTAPEMADLRDDVAQLAGPVPTYSTTHGRVEPGLLFDDRVPRAAEPGEQLSLDELLDEDRHHEDEPHDQACHRHLHDDYTSVSFRSVEPLDPRRLLDFLHDPPQGLFRAKGVVAFAVAGEGRKFTVHLVGRHIVVEPGHWGPHEEPVTEFVLIGADMASSADAEGADVLARLHAAVHIGAELLDSSAMLGVWRYGPFSAAAVRENELVDSDESNEPVVVGTDDPSAGG